MRKWRGAMDKQIVAVSTITQSMCKTAVVKRKLHQKAKLSINKSVHVPTLTYGHKLRVLTERIMLWIHADEISFPRRVTRLVFKHEPTEWVWACG